MAAAELPIPGFSNAQLLAGRVIVYLDQNLWSRLAAARHAHRPVAPNEAAAAHRLSELVDQGRVVLPVSSSHFLETVRHRGPGRLPLASTLLELCRGWQMRHPGVIGRSELGDAVHDRPRITSADVFTLESNATFLTRVEPSPPRFPEPMGSVVRHLSAVSGTYDALIDESAMADEGAEIRTRWAAAHDQLVNMMIADNISTAEKAIKIALGRLLVDLAHQSLQHPDPEIDLATFQTWLPQAEHAIADMPYLGRLWRLTFARLRNGARWQPNDLADIHFLAAAAGYANVVAGEKRTISDLSSAKGIVTGAKLAKSLSEAVAAVDQVLAAPATPQGLDGATIRTISENTTTLKVEQSGCGED